MQLNDSKQGDVVRQTEADRLPSDNMTLVKEPAPSGSPCTSSCTPLDPHQSAWGGKSHRFSSP